MFLGVDLGTSSIKILLADANGKIIDTASKEYPIYYPQPNFAEQNPTDWLNALTCVLKDLSLRHDLHEIEGISFSGQMHGLVILDEFDKVIRPAILWNDNRTVKQCAYLNDTIGKKKLIEWTGNIAFTGFTAPKLLWVKENEPQNFIRIKKIMLPKDYLAYSLTGVFASDVSDCSGTLYFNVNKRDWSKEMLEILSIDETQLPKVFESSNVIGTVSKKFALDVGLSPLTKVIIGGGDQAVGAIGTGTVGNNQFSISLGTSGVIFASSDKFLKVESGSMHSFCHSNLRYHIMGVMLSAAASLKWWVEDILQETDFDKVVNEIANTGIDDLLFLPYLMGERSPINDPYAKGAFYGLTLTHKRASITKAIIEGISFGLKDCYNTITNLDMNADYIRVIGGGAKSPEWLQVLSDILGVELRTINTSDGGGLGAIILAMVGCKKYKTVEECCKSIIVDKLIIKPNLENYKTYNMKFEQFKQLYKRLK